MIRKILFTMVCLTLVTPLLLAARPCEADVVTVRILSDRGAEFGKYRTYPQARADGRYFFVEALRGERYSIEVTNTSPARIGVVVAVDGRNIIDGKRSELTHRERMYILGPRETQTFEGWRTGADRTNRFFFTTPSDSYAEKVFSDASAMGTIAVAAYREKTRLVTPHPVRPPFAQEGLPVPGSGRSKEKTAREQADQAGTGFGATTYSPSRVVHFEPHEARADKVVMKYEWRSELCKRGIIDCGRGNRLWPDTEGFAPVPRDFRE